MSGCDRLLSRVAVLAALSGVGGLGCGGKGVANERGDTIAGTAGSSNDGPAGTAGASGTGPGCAGSDLVVAKRIVRLSFNQIVTSIGTAVDGALRASLAAKYDLANAEHRPLPPLADPREGSVYTTQTLTMADDIAQSVGQYVFDHFEAVTGCSEPSDSCAQSFLNTFAQKAFRRPLSDAESSRLMGTYAAFLKTSDTVTIPQAVQYGVYAVLASPQFLYRTELGDDWKQDGPLTSSEMASLLSYFLTDGSPDPTLLDAAGRGELSTSEQLELQVERLLRTEEAKINLQGVMSSYLGYGVLDNVVSVDPALTGPLRAAMSQEARLFLGRTLWNGKVDDLLLSRTGYVNATLAPVYGIAPFPPPGATLDADQFAEVQLPAGRTGLLTQAAFLTAHSRPDGTSVRGRGLLVRNRLVGGDTPAPPENIQHAAERYREEETKRFGSNPTERQRAELRAEFPECAQCHESFDAYGLALEPFDELGRYRTHYDDGTAIDPSVKVPEEGGGGVAKDVVEVAQKLAQARVLPKALAQGLFDYARTDPSQARTGRDSCVVAGIAEAFEASDGSFSSLVRSVATSRALRTRSKGTDSP